MWPSGVGGEFVLDPFVNLALEFPGGGAVGVGLGSVADGAAEQRAARIGWRRRRPASGTAVAVGDDAGFEGDRLADRAGEAGEDEAGIATERAGRGAGCGRLRGLDFGIWVQRRLGDRAGHRHAEFGHFLQLAQVPRRARIRSRVDRPGRDGVHRLAGRGGGDMNAIGT